MLEHRNDSVDIPDNEQERFSKITTGVLGSGGKCSIGSLGDRLTNLECKTESMVTAGLDSVDSLVVGVAVVSPVVPGPTCGKVFLNAV